MTHPDATPTPPTAPPRERYYGYASSRPMTDAELLEESKLFRSCRLLARSKDSDRAYALLAEFEKRLPAASLPPSAGSGETEPYWSEIERAMADYQLCGCVSIRQEVLARLYRYAKRATPTDSTPLARLIESEIDDAIVAHEAGEEQTSERIAARANAVASHWLAAHPAGTTREEG